MSLQIQSSARIKTPYARVLVFGDQQMGKTMLIPSAPRPLWLLTEGTRQESLTTELIESVYGRPTKAELTDWLKSEKKLKGKELEAAIADPESEREMTGITYDVPVINLSSVEQIMETVDFLKSPAAAKFETVAMDSATVVSEMMMGYHTTKKTASGKIPDNRLAVHKAFKESYQFFKDLMNLPKHLLFICHSEEFSYNIGSAEEPVWQKEFMPMLHGTKLKREAKYLFSNMFQTKREGKDDSGKPYHFLQIRPTSSYGVERTLCTRLKDREPTNLADLFDKLTGKA